MQLIHARLARSIWLFDIRDLNPKGKDILGDLALWIKHVYSFAESQAPDSVIPTAPSPIPAEAPQKTQENVTGLIFRKGRFQVEDGVYVAVNSLTVYDDGIVVETGSSTEDGDIFAGDLLKSATLEFGLAYDANTVRRRMYVSELIVRSNLNLADVNPYLHAFSERISDASRNASRRIPFVVGGISFWSEADDAGKQMVVRFERQAGKALAENRYFSDAPMQTRIHLDVLEEFERLVMRK